MFIENNIFNSPIKQMMFKIGGADEIRTRDPYHAMVVLSQLSHSPTKI